MKGKTGASTVRLRSGAGSKATVSAPPPPVSRVAFVRAQRIPELVASDVRKRVLRGELKDGDALAPEAELMVQYGVSRPTLREALRILESEQLITIRRGGIGGALVRRPDVNVAARQFSLVLQDKGCTMADVQRARMVIEPPALAELARQVTPEQVGTAASPA